MSKRPGAGKPIAKKSTRKSMARAVATKCLLTASAAQLTALVFVAGSASAQPSEWLSCLPQEHRLEAPGEATVTCELRNVGDATGTYTLDAEILSGSVNDEDGSAAPPDASAANPESPFEVRFTFASDLPGRDTVCIWHDADRDDDNIDEGGQCLDDENTEIVVVEWLPAASPRSPDPTLPASPSTETSSTPELGSPVEETAQGSPPKPRADVMGFVLVADPELSFAIDALLVVAFGIALWRWRWARAIVIESVRHPMTRSRVDRPEDGER